MFIVNYSPFGYIVSLQAGKDFWYLTININEEVDMRDIKTKLVDFLRDEEGASGIEYALIAAMVAVVLVTFISPIRTAVGTIFTSIQTALTTGSTP